MLYKHSLPHISAKDRPLARDRKHQEDGIQKSATGLAGQVSKERQADLGWRRKKLIHKREAAGGWDFPSP